MGEIQRTNSSRFPGPFSPLLLCHTYQSIWGMATICRISSWIFHVKYTHISTCMHILIFLHPDQRKKVGKGRFHCNSPLASQPTSIMQKTKPQDLHGYAYLYQPHKGGTSLPTNELLFLFVSILHDHSQECSLHHNAIFPRLRGFPPFPPHRNPKGTHANFPTCPAEILSNPFSCRNEQYDSLITLHEHPVPYSPTCNWTVFSSNPFQFLYTALLSDHTCGPTTLSSSVVADTTPSSAKEAMQDLFKTNPGLCSPSLWENDGNISYLRDDCAYTCPPSMCEMCAQKC